MCDIKEETKDQEEAVKKVLLEQYQNFTRVFLKEELDKLLLHCLYNHKIVLEGENTLDYSSLYKMTTKELEIVK